MSAIDISAQFKGLNVLVVEDNPINYMVIEQYLLKLGIDVHWGDTGEKGFDLFQGDKFDLIFMDCMLPGMSGLECTERIRQYEHSHSSSLTPVVALTADVRDSNRAACKQAGMNDFLGKPFKFDDITYMLKLWVKPDIKN